MDLHMLFKLSLVDGHNTCCDFCFADASQQRPALLIGHPNLLVKRGFTHAWRKCTGAKLFGTALPSKHLFLQPASSLSFV